MRQLVYTMFIMFHLWWKKNLAKGQKVSKYYENDGLQNFVPFFMYLLTAKFTKNSPIQARIYFIFLKNILKKPWNSFNAKFQPQWKDRKSCYQVRQILVLFRNLIALILVLKSVKDLRVTKISKEIKFEEVRGELESNKSFQEGFTYGKRKIW